MDIRYGDSLEHILRDTSAIHVGKFLFDYLIEDKYITDNFICYINIIIENDRAGIEMDFSCDKNFETLKFKIFKDMQVIGQELYLIFGDNNYQQYFRRGKYEKIKNHIIIEMQKIMAIK